MEQRFNLMAIMVGLFFLMVLLMAAQLGAHGMTCDVITGAQLACLGGIGYAIRKYSDT